jgi:pimeloyl-ACP methyl ester carboxylesterase
MHTFFHRSPWLLVLLLSATLRDSASAEDKPADLVLGDCLVLRPVGRYTRSPLHQDALEAEIVAGRWKTPKEGDRLSLPDGGAAIWEKASAAKDGALEHPALRGGYVHWKVETQARAMRLLEASGHGMVYLNGQPRTGDPYSNGIVRLPVALKAGVNDLLFHVGRGRLQARLVTPAAPVLLDPRDSTLPDLLHGAKTQPWAAVVVINASDKPLQGATLRASLDKGDPVATPVPTLPPVSQRKVGFRVPSGPLPMADSVALEVQLEEKKDDKPVRLDSVKFVLGVRKPTQGHKRTFLSGIDGSVQYYAVIPAQRKDGDAQPGLVLTLHGAAVEATGQAACYAPKSWCHVVAPTNRRPFGFDWEDWGRLDAMEVLDLAAEELRTDPLRTYLTGHSMGGHGTWHLGVTFPDRFAAIAPSAGWVSFWSYTGAPKPDLSSSLQAILSRATTPSDTLALVRNTAPRGVYILHGDADDNVPVEQARTMRQQLGGFHADFAYYERPGAGHWWGNACVDWPPLLEFLQQHKLPETGQVRQIDFRTASPGVSARSHWATIEAQVRPLLLSTIQLHWDSAKRRFSGKTDNVARLSLDVSHFKADSPLNIELDDTKLEKVPWPAERVLRLRRVGDGWIVADRFDATHKGPRRYGPFKEAFRNRMVLVYGTKGSAEENAWSYARARFDAETFWYRGNGSVDLVADVDFDPAKERDRNVILYGHSESNVVWKGLLAGSPVQVKRGMVQIDTHQDTGEDLACLFVRPRPGSEVGLVGVVSASGLAGMRLTERLPVFVSGIGYPDCLVLGGETLTKGATGVRAAGYFGPDWGVPSGEFYWRK